MPKRDNERNVKTVSYRLPIHLYNRISDWATEHGTTKTEAAVHFIERGVEAEGKAAPATSAELELLRVQMAEGFKMMAQAVENQPIAVQQVEQPKQLEAGREQAARDERDKIAQMGFLERRRYLKGKQTDQEGAEL